MLQRPSAGTGPPEDGPQPHGAHQPLHPLLAHPYPPPLQPGLHPPGPKERGLQVLTVALAHQEQVPAEAAFGPVVEAGTTGAQQRALAHQG